MRSAASYSIPSIVRGEGVELVGVQRRGGRLFMGQRTPSLLTQTALCAMLYSPLGAECWIAWQKLDRACGLHHILYSYSEHQHMSSSNELQLLLGALTFAPQSLQTQLTGFHMTCILITLTLCVFHPARLVCVWRQIYLCESTMLNFYYIII